MSPLGHTVPPAHGRPCARAAQLAQAGIRATFNQQRAILQQQREDRVYDINASLDAGIRQSRFRQRGQGGRLASDLDRIITDTRADALDLQREGLSEEARKRRRLGRDLVDERRSDFYRSLQFEEVSGSRIAAGQGFRGIERQFRDAREEAFKPGKGEPKDGPVTKEQAGTIIDILGQILTRHFRARAG